MFNDVPVVSSPLLGHLHSEMKKGPNKPKRAAGGAYGCFVAKQSAELKKECIGKPCTTVIKLASERWKDLGGELCSQENSQCDTRMRTEIACATDQQSFRNACRSLERLHAADEALRFYDDVRDAGDNRSMRTALWMIAAARMRDQIVGICCRLAGTQDFQIFYAELSRLEVAVFTTT